MQVWNYKNENSLKYALKRVKQTFSKYENLGDFENTFSLYFEKLAIFNHVEDPKIGKV